MEKPIVRGLTNSMNGKIANIVYQIKVFVKHDSITQLGEGECVSLPIKIMERPLI
jgi:hypothetical protein